MAFFHHIHCRYTGIRGFKGLYTGAIKDQYMITEKAKFRAKVLVFWEKHGLQATLDAFPVKRSALYLWKQLWEAGEKKTEALNERKTVPRTKRKRLWPPEVLEGIRTLRALHPNLGEKKLYPLLQSWCKSKEACPKPATIGRLIKDLGGLRIYPQKISHSGKVRKMNRQRVLRKPKDLRANSPGHVVALDTIERFVNGCRRYIITFEDIYSRFSFAWATTSHASRAAKEFFALCRKAFPFPFQFVLTDNGSEFKKHFDTELRKLHLVHYHTYPKTPKMNAHVERFNRTIQEEFVDYHASLLLDPKAFNRKLIDYLIFYNIHRVHHAFHNKLSPLQFILTSPPSLTSSLPQKSKTGCGYTDHCLEQCPDI